MSRTSQSRSSTNNATKVRVELRTAPRYLSIAGQQQLTFLDARAVVTTQTQDALKLLGVKQPDLDEQMAELLAQRQQYRTRQLA